MDYLTKQGPVKQFIYHVEYILHYIERFGVPMDIEIPLTQISQRDDSCFVLSCTKHVLSHNSNFSIVTPSENVAIGTKQVDTKPPSPKFDHQQQYDCCYNSIVHCLICAKFHVDKNRCPHCGPDWQPTWMEQCVAKYNTSHSDNLDPKVISPGSPL